MDKAEVRENLSKLLVNIKENIDIRELNNNDIYDMKVALEIVIYGLEDTVLNNGCRTWSIEEEEDLVREFSEGKKIREICELHDRTSGAIRKRLKVLELI